VVATGPKSVGGPIRQSPEAVRKALERLGRAEQKIFQNSGSMRVQRDHEDSGTLFITEPSSKPTNLLHEFALGRTLLAAAREAADGLHTAPLPSQTSIILKLRRHD